MTTFEQLSNDEKVEAVAKWLCDSFDPGAYSGPDEDGNFWWDDTLDDNQRARYRNKAKQLLKFTRSE